MSNILKNRQAVKASIANLGSQMMQSWKINIPARVPDRYRTTSNAVFCGMGGSNLASEMALHVFKDKISKPVILVRDYDLPVWANKNTLVILSSYSGSTEEVLSCFQQALKKNCQIVVIASGGELVKKAEKEKIPVFIVDKSLNPSGQPRYAVGAQMGTVLAIFKKTGLININQEEIEQAAEYLGILNELFAEKTAENPAFEIAKRIKGKTPLIISADFLSSNGHILANQLNESAKNLAYSFLIPELNHHLLEGLEFPKASSKNLIGLMLNASSLPERIRKRYSVTGKVLAKKNIDYIEYWIEGDNLFLAALETLSFGSWLSYYLSEMNGVDPTLIPWVDYFKKELKK